MFKQFLGDTLDLILSLGVRLGLLRGSVEWNKLRLKQRFEQRGRDAENTRRSVASAYRMCRQCRTLVPVKERRCPSCGAEMGGIPRGGAPRAIRLFAPSMGSVSAILLGVMAAAYLAGALLSPAKDSMLAPSGEMLWRLGAMVPERLLLGGQWWRVINPIFLHGGLMHIGFNCYVLANIGPLIEAVVGKRKYLVLFIFTGVSSFVFSALGALLFTPHWSVGASGSIFGLLGFGMVAGFRRGSGVLRRAAPNFLVWTLINFVIGFSVSMVDNGAHLGGFLAGALAGLIFQDSSIRSALADRAWTVLAVLAALLPVAGFLAALVLT